MGVLRDLEEVVVLVLLADAAGDVSVLGDGVAQEVADHGELIAAVAVRVALEVLVYLPEALGAVVVVGVDDGEGAVDYVAGGEDGVAGAPGLDAAVGDRIAGRQVVELLVGVLDVYELGEPVAYGLVEGLLYLVLDDEHDGVEAGALGVVDGVVDDELAVAAHGVYLLETAVAAAHSGGHDDEPGFLHCFFLPQFCLKYGPLPRAISHYRLSQPL